MVFRFGAGVLLYLCVDFFLFDHLSEIYHVRVAIALYFASVDVLSAIFPFAFRITNVGLADKLEM